MVSSLKEARLKNDLSIENAARKLGISAGYLSQIENGLRKVSKERAVQISNLYRVDKDKIFLATRYSIRIVEDGNLV